MKLATFLRTSSLIALIVVTTHAPIARAAEPTNEASVSSSFFSVSSIIKNLFQRNVTEKKENLEKNRDIRNKLIEEKQTKLNIKFNREKVAEPSTTVTSSTTPTVEVVQELVDQVVKLNEIKLRLDSRIEKLDDASDAVIKATNYSALAGDDLTIASTSLAFIQSTTTPTVDSLYSTKIDALVDAVKNVKEAHLALIEAIAALSESTTSPIEQ